MKRALKLIAPLLILVAAVVLPVAAQDSVPNAVIKASDSVVRVFSDYEDGWVSGTGFVISNNSYETLIATNNHVLENDPISISIWTEEAGDLTDVSIVCTSPAQDLCILKLAGSYKFKALNVNTKAAKGDKVYAVGFPGAADYLSDELAHTSTDTTITDGIISAARTLTLENGSAPIALYQISTPINHGNSGGPLLDTKGNVVGINTYGIQDAEGVNGAIAVSELIILASTYGITLSQRSFPIWLVLVAVLAALAAFGVVLLLVKQRKKKKQKKNKSTGESLRTYIARFPNGLQPEQAVFLLMPLAVQLRNMHENGVPHLQISPDTISVAENKAVLEEPTADESKRYITGFAAPEIYKGQSKGQSSDVYSFCAVLYYAVSGQVPPNALSRQDDALEALTDEAFQSVVLKGMAMDADARYPSMRDLILAMSPYNTLRVLPDVQSAQSPVETKKQSANTQKKSRWKPWRIVACCILTVVVLLTAAYWGSYSYAARAADNGDFGTAEKYLLLPSVTALHDPLLIDYVNAGLVFSRQDYQRAESLFSNLSGYRDSQRLAKLSRYYSGIMLFNRGELESAYAIFSDLAVDEYEDSVMMMNECRYYQGIQYYNNGDYDNAIPIFSELSENGHTDAYVYCLKAGINKAINQINRTNGSINSILVKARIQIDELTKIDSTEAARLKGLLDEEMYKKALKFYNSKEYGSASAFFYGIKGYKDADKFVALSNLANHKITDEYYNKAIQNLQFANTKEVLVSYNSIAKKFLAGTWRSKDNRYYFTMGTNSSSYNLPSENLSNSFYNISDGVYSLVREDGLISYYLHKEDGKNIKKLFKFVVLTEDSMNVFCYKTGKTYRMYRQ